MKRITLQLVLIVGLILSSILPAYSATIAGESCKKSGQTSTVKGVKYTCIKLGKKLYWDNGVKIGKTSSETLRICSGAEKALIMNLNNEWHILIGSKESLLKQLNSYRTDDEKQAIAEKVNLLDIKILNISLQRENIEESCNSEQSTSTTKLKNCTNKEIQIINIWAETYRVQQNALKIQWDKVEAATQLLDQKSKQSETRKHQKIYDDLARASDVKKQEFEALNGDCLNSGVKLPSTFIPGKAAADKAAADKAAADKAAADKVASDKLAGKNLPKVGDCWDYPDYKPVSGNRSPISCGLLHTSVTYKLGFWPKTTQDPYILLSQGDEMSMAMAASYMCESIQRYEENLKKGNNLSYRGFFLPDKAAWDKGERWINCLEAKKFGGVFIAWKD